MSGSVPVLLWAQCHTDVSRIHISWVSAKPKLSAVRFKFSFVESREKRASLSYSSLLPQILRVFRIQVAN